MTTVTPDQGITLQVGTDPAYLPSAQTAEVAGFENRLVRRYVDAADRTARAGAAVENAVTALAAENRVDINDGTNDISLHTRSVRAVRMAVLQNLTVSSTAFQNLTALVVPVENGGVYQFDAVLFFDGPAAGDIKFDFVAPALSTGFWGGHGPALNVASNSGDGVWGVSPTMTGSIAYGASGTGTGNTSMVRLAGEMTAAAAGTLQLRAAQNTADAGQTVVRERSRLHVWRVL